MPDNPTGQLARGIGVLRWTVTLYRRDQEPGPNEAITETLVPIGVVHADVQPTYPSTLYNSTAVDTPVTHLITTRWLDYIETTNVIIRNTTWPEPRAEIFRVRRAKEVAGRKRFCEFECEFERWAPISDDSDAARSQAFAENSP
jgi:hypothetical protein